MSVCSLQLGTSFFSWIHDTYIYHSAQQSGWPNSCFLWRPKEIKSSIFLFRHSSCSCQLIYYYFWDIFVAYCYTAWLFSGRIFNLFTRNNTAMILTVVYTRTKTETCTGDGCHFWHKHVIDICSILHCYIKSLDAICYADKIKIMKTIIAFKEDRPIEKKGGIFWQIGASINTCMSHMWRS